MRALLDMGRGPERAAAAARARDRAVATRTLDHLAAALGVDGHRLCDAECIDAKAKHEIREILAAAGLTDRGDGIYKLLVWQPIATAPKIGTVDLWAETWVAGRDAFVWARFPDCTWVGDGPVRDRGARWAGLPDGYFATHWMAPPVGPEGRAHDHATAHRPPTG